MKRTPKSISLFSAMGFSFLIGLWAGLVVCHALLGKTTCAFYGG